MLDSTYCKALPKVELHAHLTGSIRRRTLHDVWRRKAGQTKLRDPLTAIPPAANGVNINTFFPIFSTYIYELIDTRDDVIFTTRAVLEAFADDGVAYLELRTTPRGSKRDHAFSAEDYIRLVLEVIQKHNAEQLELVTRLILSVDRRGSVEEAWRTLELAKRYRGAGVVGLDLCGDPCAGDVSDFRDIFLEAKREGLGVTVHFGEVKKEGLGVEEWEMLSWDPHRLGHVVHCASEEIRAEIFRRRLGLELCLSCNVLAGMSEGGFKAHHFGTWRTTGCPIALGTDDVGIFESELSHEYVLTSKHFGVDREAVIRCCYEACSIIFGSADDRERIERLLDKFQQLHEV